MYRVVAIAFVCQIMLPVCVGVNVLTSVDFDNLVICSVRRITTGQDARDGNEKDARDGNEKC